jgi:predicted CDP-diglyceride synthetase/phosphatidate cytidylyltransferase
MEFLQSDKFDQNKEVIILICIILGILVFATVLFFIWGKIKSTDQLKELKMRTNSWWVMASIFVLATLLHPVLRSDFYHLQQCAN